MNRSPLILVVEDDEADILFLKRAFLKIGLKFPFQVAQTGSLAMEYLAGEGRHSDRSASPAPTHLLMDLKIPEKSGFELLEWIRLNPALKGLPVTILTSSSEMRDLRRAEELGADCYLVKPMSFSVLTEYARGIEAWVLTGRIPPESRIPLLKESQPHP